jgi:hypothetical protein
MGVGRGFGKLGKNVLIWDAYIESVLAEEMFQLQPPSAGSSAFLQANNSFFYPRSFSYVVMPYSATKTTVWASCFCRGRGVDKISRHITSTGFKENVLKYIADHHQRWLFGGSVSLDTEFVVLPIFPVLVTSASLGGSLLDPRERCGSEVADPLPNTSVERSGSIRVPICPALQIAPLDRLQCGSRPIEPHFRMLSRSPRFGNAFLHPRHYSGNLNANEEDSNSRLNRKTDRLLCNYTNNEYCLMKRSELINHRFWNPCCHPRDTRYRIVFLLYLTTRSVLRSYHLSVLIDTKYLSSVKVHHVESLFHA